uniref:Uncharacterized protein n=1 Tax=Kryptolebias marmoratus TaxID=37003 RepID=A0A3Q2ZZ93_KRYMA
QPPKTKQKKGGKGKLSAVMSRFSTEEMSKDQVRSTAANTANCVHITGSRLPAAGGAHHSPPRGAGPGARGEELLPAGAGQDPGLLGDLQEGTG